MKKVVVFLVLIFSFASCKKERYEKPDNLIDEFKMSDILYDISIFYAAKGINLKDINPEEVKLDSLIYKKFNVDSAQFASSSVYYASDINTYINIYKRVEDRLKNDKDLLAKKEEALKKTRDSIRKARVEKNKGKLLDTTKIFSEKVKAVQ